MSPKKQPAVDAATALATNGFNDGDTQLILAIFKHGPKPSPNWEAVKEEIGSASTDACKKRLSLMAIKHGLFLFTGTAANAETPTKATPKAKTPRGKKRSAAEAAGSDDNAAVYETPVKKTRKWKANTPKTKLEPELEDKDVKDGQDSEDMKDDLADGEA